MDRLIYSDMQQHNDHHCRNLNYENGRCKIYEVRPFSCDFELLRFAISIGERANQLTTRLYGRGWQFLRVDDQRGALCELTSPTEETKLDAVRKLKRLQEWSNHLGIKTKLDTIIKWVESGPHKEALILEVTWKQS